MEFKSGRPPEITEEVKARLLEAVPLVIIQNQVAYYAKVPPSNLSRWLKRGEKDANENIDSIYSQFWHEFKATQAQVVREKFESLNNCPKNYGALTWILEKCFREDFGKESDEIKNLLEIVEKTLVMAGIMRGSSNGRKETKEVDSESDQASRCLA